MTTFYFANKGNHHNLTGFEVVWNNKCLTLHHCFSSQRPCCQCHTLWPKVIDRMWYAVELIYALKYTLKSTVYSLEWSFLLPFGLYRVFLFIIYHWHWNLSLSARLSCFFMPVSFSSVGFCWSGLVQMHLPPPQAMVRVRAWPQQLLPMHVVDLVGAYPYTRSISTPCVCVCVSSIHGCVCISLYIIVQV